MEYDRLSSQIYGACVGCSILEEVTINLRGLYPTLASEPPTTLGSTFSRMLGSNLRHLKLHSIMFNLLDLRILFSRMNKHMELFELILAQPITDHPHPWTQIFDTLRELIASFRYL